MIMRRIVVDGQTFKWKVGRSNISFVLPGGLRSYASFVEVTGVDWNEIERGQWKRYFKITPKQVADFIRRTWL